MTTTTAPAPEVTVTAGADGTGTLTIDGTPRELRGDSLQGVVGAALDAIVQELVKPAGHPVLITANDPSGSYRLRVDVDGTVSPVPDEPAPTAAHDETAQEDAGEDEPRPADAGAVPDVDHDDEHLAELGAEEAAQPERAPQTRREARLSARDFVQSQPTPKAAPAREGWRGGANRAGFGMLRLAPGTLELTRRGWRSSVQRGIAGHKTIVVIGEKGGVSKTTTTYLLSAVLGRVRGGTILAWDNNEYNGSLGGRAYEAHHDHTARDLLGHIDTFTDQAHQADLVNFVRPQRDNKFDVLASQNAVGNTRVIEADEFRKLYTALTRFYRLIIVDTGNNSEASTWRAAVESADQLVLTSLVKEDSAVKIASLADKLDATGLGDKLANAVTLINHNSPINYPDLEQRLHDHMAQRTRQVVTVPFDKALDAGAGIEYDALTAASKEAWLAATAAVIDGLR
jgi:MinD-like ATPase involved in chromosome partitioning or flagellar assembly